MAVSPKALDVLEVLLEQRGRTVEKDDLLHRVWYDTAVEESNLTQSVFVLRRALGDNPGEAQYISTVARRGYRFVGAATEIAGGQRPDEHRHLHRTANIQAYHAYLKGRHAWARRDADSLRAAISCFRQAIDLDPTYALAYVGLAECFVVQRGHCWPGSPEVLVMARAAATRALEIDETLAEAHATLGVIQMVFEWNWAAAQQSFRCAIDLAPDYATTRNWYASCLAALGRLDEAILEAREAVRLDPLNVTWHMGVGHMLFLARRYREAIEVELNVLDVDPQFWLAHWILGLSYEQISDSTRAIEALQKADELSSGNLMVRGMLGRILGLRGSTDEACQLLDEILSRRGRDTAPAEIAGLIHAGLDDASAAFDCFERAAREGSYLLIFLNVSPVFDQLRSHQRFGALQRLVRLA